MKAAAHACEIYGYCDSPIGSLLVAGDAEHVSLISFPTGKTAQSHLPEWRRDDAHFTHATSELAAYFARELTDFTFAIRFDGTEFQNRVWTRLRSVPFGTTMSYGELAAAIDHPTASRAVGAANGQNPLPIIIPCHRIIGSNTKLTGFGGGLETKEFLLNHENAGSEQLALL